MILCTLLLALAPQERLTSGEALTPEEAAYDVQHYDLAITVDPGKRRIDGVLKMRARMVAKADVISLNLERPLKTSRILVDGKETGFGRVGRRLRLAAPPEGKEFEVTVYYGGEPREAPRPPWDGGFTWAKTAEGKPWIATSCQMQGADLWWPCKDQPGDEADSMDLHVTIPADLDVATNGRFVGVEDAHAGWRTHHWHVSSPINSITRFDE